MDFNLPRDSVAGYVNNQREHYEYKFNGVIPPDAKQDEVWWGGVVDRAAREGFRMGCVGRVRWVGFGRTETALAWL